METIIDNWFVIVGLICLLIMVGYVLINFLGLPTPKQTEKVKEWMLYAVIEAQSKFGTDTGELKLRFVYDAFLSKFPMASRFISFKTFKKLVDKALEEMKVLLEKKENIKSIVEGNKLKEGE